MKRKLNNDKFLITMYGIAVFCLLFLFFFRFNPLVVYDTDDWLYVGQFRKPIPIIGGWNPIKVFPETFMPLVSLIGVKCINPFINDYCLSLTIAHSFFGGLILTFYFIEVALLFYKKKLASLIQSILYGLLFFVLHFITNIHTGNNNPFLLWSRDLTCFYNYTLSAIINASLVIHIIAEG